MKLPSLQAVLVILATFTMQTTVQTVSHQVGYAIRVQTCSVICDTNVYSSPIN